MLKFKGLRNLKKNGGIVLDRHDSIVRVRNWLVPAWFVGATMWLGARLLWLVGAMSTTTAVLPALLGSLTVAIATPLLFGLYRIVVRERIEGYAHSLKSEFGKPLYGLRYRSFLFGNIWAAEDRVAEMLRRYLGDLRRIRSVAQAWERRDKKMQVRESEPIRRIDGLWDHLTPQEQEEVLAFIDQSPTSYKLQQFLSERLHRIALRERDKGETPRRVVEFRPTKQKLQRIPQAAEAKREILPARSLTLSEVESGLAIEAFLPDTADKAMAKSILLELMDLGGRKTAFGESYRAEDTLKRMVVRRYGREKKQFDRRSFVKTLRWLRQEGIVRSKRKTDEEVFSLSPKPSTARSEAGATVIREVVRFYNNFSTPG